MKKRTKYKQPKQKSSYWPIIIFGLSALIAVSAWAILTKPKQESSIMPHVDTRIQYDGTDSLVAVRCMETTRNLVLSHPDTMVSKWANREIEERRLYLNYQSSSVVGASAFASFQVINAQGVGLVPVLSIDATGLLDNAMPDIEKQLIIRHELEHYRQYLAKRFSIETYFERNTDAPFEDWEIRNLVVSESEAYEAESYLALRVGAQPNFNIVRGFLDGGYEEMLNQLVATYSELPLLALRRSRLQYYADSLIAARQKSTQAHEGGSHEGTLSDL